MTRLLAAIGAFLVTIAALMLMRHAPIVSPQPSSEAAQIYSEVRQDRTMVAPKTPSPTPASTPVPSHDLVPSILVTPISSPTPTPTPISTPTATATPTPTATLTPTPTPTSTTTPSGNISVISLTSPVAQKQTATIKIQTDPVAACTIEVTLPSGTVSTSKDLGPKTADGAGQVIWSWNINWNTKPGNAIIKLACQSNGKTHSGQTTMQIIASQ